MGLTVNSVGRGAIDGDIQIKRCSESEKIIAFAGNPNVGKSTIFNALTGMNQHTGNWPGKTVTSAQGFFRTAQNKYILVDTPGTYSLFPHSAEEEVARNFICFGRADATVVICDATCLARNLNLVLQIIESVGNVVVCINLLDEAKRKHIRVDLKKLENLLGVPVVGTVARKKKSLCALKDSLDRMVRSPVRAEKSLVPYPDAVSQAVDALAPAVKNAVGDFPNAKWVSLRLLEEDPDFFKNLHLLCGRDLTEDTALSQAIAHAKEILRENQMDAAALKEIVTTETVKKATEIGEACTQTETDIRDRDRIIDRVLTGKITAYPVMLLLLALIFWLTITGANAPSSVLSAFFTWLGGHLNTFLTALRTPLWLHGILMDGVYRVLTAVIAVMLPPMAIFFPLFTLLEDVGYLPRIAYNLDRPFQCCHACGKQALTMCMGFGCNAAGVTGCRIIDSPRERLIAVLTNNFVPCNGRFPALITLIGLLWLGTEGGNSALSALILTLLVLLGIALTFLVSKLLSVTLLRGVPSSFTLELPPYRKPQIGKVIVRSIFDRTLFVLGRSVAVAAPAGIVIWLLANLQFGGTSLLQHGAALLDPFARWIGLDGAILLAFMLGFPANEIVLPILFMIYTSGGTLTEFGSLAEIRSLLLANGWNSVTVLCTMLFFLFHFPCSTTVLTVHKETGSLKWTLLSILLPTAVGILICAAVANAARLFGI